MTNIQEEIVDFVGSRGFVTFQQISQICASRFEAIRITFGLRDQKVLTKNPLGRWSLTPIGRTAFDRIHGKRIEEKEREIEAKKEAAQALNASKPLYKPMNIEGVFAFSQDDLLIKLDRSTNGTSFIMSKKDLRASLEQEPLPFPPGVRRDTVVPLSVEAKGDFWVFRFSVRKSVSLIRFDKSIMDAVSH